MDASRVRAVLSSHAFEAISRALVRIDVSEAIACRVFVKRTSVIPRVFCNTATWLSAPESPSINRRRASAASVENMRENSSALVPATSAISASPDPVAVAT